MLVGIISRCNITENLSIFFLCFRLSVTATAMMNILTVTDRRGLPGSWILFQLTVKCQHMDSAMRRVKITPSMSARTILEIFILLTDVILVKQ